MDHVYSRSKYGTAHDSTMAASSSQDHEKCGAEKLPDPTLDNAYTSFEMLFVEEIQAQLADSIAPSLAGQQSAQDATDEPADEDRYHQKYVSSLVAACKSEFESTATSPSLTGLSNRA